MSDVNSEIAIEGSVTLTVTANIRQGEPSTASPVMRKMPAGTVLAIHAIVAGAAVEGNPHWYRIDGNAFVWAGACSALHSLATGALPIIAPNPGPPVAGAALKPLVVDLFHGDAVFSFAEAFAAGVLGIIHKATTGASGRDDAYQRRRPQAIAAGMLWGAYHWGTAAPAADQVDNFLTWAQPDDDTLVALDFESDVGNQMTLQGARDFLTLLGKKLGRKPVLYSGSVAKQALSDRNDPFFGSHRLWLAQYGPDASVQASWDSYWLWQYSEGAAGDPRAGTVPGLPGNAAKALDCNAFAGTAEQLKAEWTS